MRRAVTLLLAGVLWPACPWRGIEAAGAGGDPDSIDALWDGFDPRAEPLEEEVFRSDDEDGGRIRIDWLYFTGQTFDGEKTRVFAYRGAPREGKGLPGVLHIHGGGQTAHIDWPRYWARRGFACVSFDFCGDTNLPNLGPGYQREHFTRWGKIEANMMKIGGGTQMDPTPRHNPWHNWVRMARRALTLLERHPQVDPERLGIFGISVGGTMTWMVAGLDRRVKAAVPIYGNGWESYRYPLEGPQDPADRPKALWRRLIAPEAHAPRITCPILFLSATNDGHGKMDLAARTLALTRSSSPRQLFTAGYDHHIQPAEALSLELWMKAHLLGDGGPWPRAPRLHVESGESPRLRIEPDLPGEVEGVEAYYCLNNRVPMSRFWIAIDPLPRTGDGWTGTMPFHAAGDTIFAFATAAYRSGRRVTSELVEVATAALAEARPVLGNELLVSTMDTPRDWYFVPAYTDPNRGLGFFEAWTGPAGEKGFTFDPAMFGPRINFHIGTHKLGAPPWRGASGRRLALDMWTACLPESLEVRVVEANRQPEFREYVLKPALAPGPGPWTALEIRPGHLVHTDGKVLSGWEKVDFLSLTGAAPASRRPVFRSLRWEVE